jgi:glycosyltransferase involved in cell wall biosynthesis
MFADELTAAGVEVRDLGMRPGRDVVGGALRLARLLRETRPDMVVSWMYHASLLDLLARPLAGTARRARMVWFLQGSLDSVSSMRPHTRLTIRILARTSGRPEAIAINSVAGRSQHADAGFSPARWVHLPNGCDTDRFAPDPEVRARVRHQLGIGSDELVIVFVGRNHPEKGFDLLLDAIPRLRGIDRTPVLLLVGAGTQHAAVERGTGPRVIALGERDDVADLLRCADALVLPSRTEGTPNAVIEAMATALPCVVTDVGDSADVVGDTGIIVTTPSVEGLGAGIRELIALSDEERHQRGAAARERVISRHALGTARSLYRSLWTEAPR